jgi:hypothetical protein
MNKAYLDDNPNLAEQYRDKPMHLGVAAKYMAPLCGAAEHLFTTAEVKYVDCPECLKQMGE